MASDINTVTLTGNLTRDPESRADGKIAAMRLAVTVREKQGEEWGDVPNYFDVDVFGALAGVCLQYLAKGRAIAVTGRLRYREWESDGSKRSAVSIAAHDVKFFSTGSAGSAPVGGDEAAQRHGGDEEIPF
jgi:single-strand DNA-binding protein